jgi:hypothetical protein
MEQETAVDYIFRKLDVLCRLTPQTRVTGTSEEWQNLFEQAKEIEKEQSHNYADFCVRCDRDQMKLLDFNDYMKIYTNGL